jgi:hypothetical protein
VQHNTVQPPEPDSTELWNLKEKVLICERELLRVLGFDLSVEHAYRPLLAYIKSIQGTRDLAQIAWNFSKHEAACRHARTERATTIRPLRRLLAAHHEAPLLSLSLCTSSDALSRAPYLLSYSRFAFLCSQRLAPHHNLPTIRATLPRRRRRHDGLQLPRGQALEAVPASERAEWCAVV